MVAKLWLLTKQTLTTPFLEAQNSTGFDSYLILQQYLSAPFFALRLIHSPSKFSRGLGFNDKVKGFFLHKFSSKRQLTSRENFTLGTRLRLSELRNFSGVFFMYVQPVANLMTSAPVRHSLWRAKCGQYVQS